MPDARTARRSWFILALLVGALALAWRAGTFDSRRTRRFLEPPTQAEMNEAAARDSARRARQAAAPAFSPLDPPVTLGRMALWLSLPIAGTVMLVLFTGRRRA